MRAKSSILPSGYTQYDWVQCDSTTGSPAIDTGIMLSSNELTRWTFDTDFARCGTMPATWTRFMIFHNTNENYDTGFGVTKIENPNNNVLTFDYANRYGGTKVQTTVISLGKWYHITLTRNEEGKRGGLLILDDEQITGQNEKANYTNKSLYLLGSYNGKAAYYCRLARFRVYSYDELYADLVPAKRDSDGVVGFYDVVRDIFCEPTAEGVTLIAGNGLNDFTI